MAEEKDSNNGRNISEYIKQFGAFGIIITSFALGIAIAGAFWSSSVSVLNTQLTIYREEANRATQELMQVKADYLTYRTITPETQTKIITDTVKSTANSVVTQPPIDMNLTEERSISTETSYSFFSGDVTISLVGIAFEGYPLRHRVVANISSPNGQVVKIDRQDIGNVITYKTMNTYKITILNAETFSARFQVVKLKPNDK